MHTYDLAVVGCGPAGAAAAITASRAGLDVVVVDKATFPRDKTCGDGLTAAALRLLRALGVDARELVERGDAVAPAEAVLVSPSGREVVVPLGPELAVTVTRRALDAELHARVVARGIEVRSGVRVVDVDTSADDVRLACTNGAGDEQTTHEIDARWVVAADGHWSPVRRAMHREAPARLGEWHAVRQYFEHAGDGRLWVCFDDAVLPGYAWVFPLPGGHANVGFGVLRDDRPRRSRGRDLKDLWPELLQHPALQRALGAQAAPIEGVRAWPIPTRYEPSSLADGRVLFAGDAAAVVDPMTGEGIAQALETGVLAARAIALGGDVAGRYRAGVDEAIGRDLRFAAALQRVLRHPTGARAALRAVDLSDWTRRSFARWMFEDYPRATVLTPSRWRRLRTAS